MDKMISKNLFLIGYLISLSVTVSKQTKVCFTQSSVLYENHEKVTYVLLRLRKLKENSLGRFIPLEALGHLIEEIKCLETGKIPRILVKCPIPVFTTVRIF